KGCGKSAPRLRQRRRHGKPHREQDRIGAAHGLARSSRPGWLLEARGDAGPRGMVAQSREGWTEPGLQALWLCFAPDDDLGDLIAYGDPLFFEQANRALQECRRRRCRLPARIGPDCPQAAEKGKSVGEALLEAVSSNICRAVARCRLRERGRVRIVARKRGEPGLHLGPPPFTEASRVERGKG